MSLLETCDNFVRRLRHLTLRFVEWGDRIVRRINSNPKRGFGVVTDLLAMFVLIAGALSIIVFCSPFMLWYRCRKDKIDWPHDYDVFEQRGAGITFGPEFANLRGPAWGPQNGTWTGQLMPFDFNAAKHQRSDKVNWKIEGF